jgi:hypothetical protein
METGLATDQEAPRAGLKKFTESWILEHRVLGPMQGRDPCTIYYVSLGEVYITTDHTDTDAAQRYHPADPEYFTKLNRIFYSHLAKCEKCQELSRGQKPLQEQAKNEATPVPLLRK